MTNDRASQPRIRDIARKSIYDFFDFLSQPSLVNQREKFSRTALITLVALFLFDLVCEIPLGFALDGYSKDWGIPTDDPLEDKLPQAFIFVFATVIAPIVEEPLFRGWVTGNRTWAKVVLAVVSLCGFVLIAHKLDVAANWFTLELLALLMILFYWIWRGWGSKEPLSCIKNHPRSVLWGSSAAFALVHLTNYKYDNYIVLLPMVIPQFVGGLVLAYVRIRFGMLANITMHSLFNALLFGLAIVFPDG